MPTQTEAGKAFEFSLLEELFKALKPFRSVEITFDKAYEKAKSCFNLFPTLERRKYDLASTAAVKHLFELEPRLSQPTSSNDKIELSIVLDQQGMEGDVRDILIIRKLLDWEIGISAKNHHKAVKHSRLSDQIDFGKKWVGIFCSEFYFHSIQPIFDELRLHRKKGMRWSQVPKKEETIYYPILKSFIKELLRIEAGYSSKVSPRLLQYLIGSKDFYKVVKGNNTTTIQGFNLNGTLNRPAREIKPNIKISKPKLPTRIIELDFKKGSQNTAILTCDQGWQLSFRIHNASSRVEPSLKFDINLISHPESLYVHHIPWA